MTNANNINKELSEAKIVFRNQSFSIHKKSETQTIYLTCEKVSQKTQQELNDIKSGYDLTISLCQYPSEELLTLAYTKDLQEYWYGLRLFNFNVAIEFLGSYLKIEGRSLDVDTENELIKELIHYCGARYYDLWNIVKLTFSYVKKQFPIIPDNEKSLFLKIVEDELNYPFEQVVLEDYTIMDMKRVSELAKKVAERFNNKNKYLEIDKNKMSLLSALILLVSQSKKLAKNRLLRFHAERYNQATQHMAMVVYDMTITRTAQGLMTPSWVWKSGKVINNPWGRKSTKSVTKITFYQTLPISTVLVLLEFVTKLYALALEKDF